MAAEDKNILPDFPAPPGNKMDSVANILGPTSYSQISIATPPTGGQTIKPSDFGGGYQSFDGVSVDLEEATGAYGVRVVPVGLTALGTGIAQVQLQWYTLATGAEVSGSTNLSAKVVRLRARGLQ